MMDRILQEVEGDPHYLEMLKAQHMAPEATTADAICYALQVVVETYPCRPRRSCLIRFQCVACRPKTVCGSHLTLTPNVTTARRLATFGVHAVVIEDIDDTPKWLNRFDAAIREGFAVQGDRMAIAAGMPFGTSGTTNLLRVARIPETQKDEQS